MMEHTKKNSASKSCMVQWQKGDRCKMKVTTLCWTQKGIVQSQKVLDSKRDMEQFNKMSHVTCMSERCTGLKNLVHSRFTNKTILYNEIRYFNVYRIASFKLARFRKCPRIWFLPASVNRLDFCLRTSADMTFVSKRQQMSAEFSFVIFCVAFVPGKLLLVSRLCFCMQMSANVSIFVFCHQM